MSSLLDSSDLECEDVITVAQSLKDRGDAYDCSNQLTTDVASKIHIFEKNLKLGETYRIVICVFAEGECKMPSVEDLKICYVNYNIDRECVATIFKVS